MPNLDPLPHFRLTVKNYRGFSDQEPLRLDLGPGFTAFVGPNNAGKSTLLRLFYELRGIFRTLLYAPDYTTLFAHGGRLELNGVVDVAEIFHDENERDLTLELRLPDSSATQVSGATITIPRASPNMWSLRLALGPGSDGITGVASGENGWHANTAGGNYLLVDLSPYYRVIAALGKTLYIGPFRNVSPEGSGIQYDLRVGTAFVEAWNQWKTGGKEQKRAIQRVQQDISRIFGFRHLEINAGSGGSELEVVVDGKPYRLRELGAGLAQFIVVFGNAVFDQPRFLLVDEPESHLHPALQIDFLTSLASYAEHGVFFATHSLGLARSTAERVYSLRKIGPSSVVRPFEQTPNYAEFAGAMSFSAFKEMGHDLILLVEGVSEVKAVQQFLRALGKDHRVVIIPLGGSQLIKRGMQQELAELTRLTDNVAVLIDSERASEGAALDPERQGFVDECRALRFSVHVSDWRAFENYLGEDAIRRVKGPKYRALLPFELLNDAEPAWAKHENWKVAREMSVEEVLATDIGRFLDGL